jgi:hypothetical protein
MIFPKKSLRKFLIYVLFILGKFCIVFGTDGLAIYVFSVGVGNFVIIRYKADVLVVDCGGVGCFTSAASKDRVRNIVGNCDRVTCIISHDHQDHYSALGILDQCLPNIPKENKNFYHGWFDRSRKVERSRVILQERSIDLLTCLGNDISICWIIPSKRVMNAHPHINNLVLGIRYGDISFVFPGDANQDWLSENHQKLKNLIQELQGVNFLLISHHGSMNDTGFVMQHAIERSNVNGAANANKEMLCVISSHPGRGKYYMPRQGIQSLFSPCRNNEIKLHDLSLAKISPDTGKFKEVVIEKGLTSPIFSTADTILGYKIVSDGKDLWMYEEFGIPTQTRNAYNLKVFDSAGLATPR